MGRPFCLREPCDLRPRQRDAVDHGRPAAHAHPPLDLSGAVGKDLVRLAPRAAHDAALAGAARYDRKGALHPRRLDDRAAHLFRADVTVAVDDEPHLWLVGRRMRGRRARRRRSHGGGCHVCVGRGTRGAWAGPSRQPAPPVEGAAAAAAAAAARVAAVADEAAAMRRVPLARPEVSQTTKRQQRAEGADVMVLAEGRAPPLSKFTPSLGEARRRPQPSRARPGDTTAAPPPQPSCGRLRARSAPWDGGRSTGTAARFEEGCASVATRRTPNRWVRPSSPPRAHLPMRGRCDARAPVARRLRRLRWRRLRRRRRRCSGRGRRCGAWAL